MARFVPQTLTSAYAAISKLNDNFSEIADLLELCLFRDGTSPNQMEANLNMNNFLIQNLADGVDNQDAVTISQLNSFVVSSGTDFAIFTAGLPGLAPASGGGTVNFLRADGTWADPSASTTTWGSITGTLSSQTDLQTVLDTKADTDVVTSGAAGLAPASGGGTTNFLRADGTWAAPSVGGALAFSVTFDTTGGAAATAEFDGTANIIVDYSTIGAAPLDSPALTGIPTAPTAAGGTSTTQLATTAFVSTALATLAFAPDFATVTGFTGNRTLADADNNVYLKKTGTTGTVTLNSTPTAGFSCIVANRGSGAVTLSAASGVYINGATATTTSATLAAGGVIILFHEGSGVWTASGTNLT